MIDFHGETLAGPHRFPGAGSQAWQGVGPGRGADILDADKTLAWFIEAVDTRDTRIAGEAAYNLPHGGDVVFLEIVLDSAAFDMDTRARSFPAKKRLNMVAQARRE